MSIGGVDSFGHGQVRFLADSSLWCRDRMQKRHTADIADIGAAAGTTTPSRAASPPKMCLGFERERERGVWGYRLSGLWGF